MDSNTIKLFQSKKTDDWATPRNLYNQLDQEFHFDLDPCPLNSEFDGLSIPWKGNIFCNPPYLNVIGFLKKAHEELKKGNAKVIVFLVFANTDTAWFHDYVYGKAELRFIRGRIKFEGISKNGAMRPSMLCIFRANNYSHKPLIEQKQESFIK
jgi:site-specific DNA-methyltransferase (adenine-specific)